MSVSWLKQTKDKPLYPEILWSRPENKRLAGKLLIIGGNLHSFNAVSAGFSAADQAGAGHIRLVLPDALHKSLHKLLPEAEFAASTPSGSFARNALEQLLDAATWADGVLLVGDFGRNSETAILLESFTQKYSGRLTLSGDSLDYFFKNSVELLSRSNTLLTTEVGQLQKLAAGQGVLIKHSMNLQQLVEAVGELGQNSPAMYLVKSDDIALLAVGDKVVTTPSSEDLDKLSAFASVFWLQNPERPFEAVCSSLTS